MAETTQKIIDDLISFIRNTDEAESVTNEMIARVLDYLNMRYKNIGSDNEQSPQPYQFTPKVIDIKDIDTMGGVDDMSSLVNKDTDDPLQTMYLVMDNYSLIGVLHVIGDNMGHLLTQIIETHCSFNNGILIQNEHNDKVLNRFYRSYNFMAPTLDVERGCWTKWQECIPTAITDALVSLSKGIEAQAKGCGILSFDGFISGNTYSEIGQINSSKAPGIYYSPGLKLFGYFNNGDFDPASLDNQDEYNLADGRASHLYRYGRKLYQFMSTGSYYEFMTDKDLNSINSRLASLEELKILRFDGIVNSEADAVDLQGVYYVSKTGQFICPDDSIPIGEYNNRPHIYTDGEYLYYLGIDDSELQSFISREEVSGEINKLKKTVETLQSQIDAIRNTLTS